MRFSQIFIPGLMLLLLLAGPLAAAEPKPIEMVIEPRAIESPILKYRLLPTESELKPGNAVPILLRMPWEQTPFMTKIYPTLHEWDERPLTAPEWATSNGVLPEIFYSEMKRAAFRRDAQWEYPIYEDPSPYMILLPDVQGLRHFLGRGLAARIRYHLSRGELDQAREGILVGLANSRHLAHTPFYVNQGVAMAIQRTMLERTDELISQPNSPNLYWALSALPVSLIELDRAASLEGGIFTMTFPGASDLDHPRDTKEWSKMARQLIEVLELLEEIPAVEKAKEDGSVVDQFLKSLNFGEKSRLSGLIKHARAELPELLKIPPEKVVAMSDDEVGVRWYVHKRLARDQLMSAALVLPPREAWPQLTRVQTETKAMREKTGAKGPYHMDPTAMFIAAWSQQRKVQALRVIEAVRHHLATHEGKLPKTLDEIQNLPIPLDPLTSQPFQWSVEGQSAVLKAPPLPADLIESDSATVQGSVLEYRLRVK
jgi:hypothetical protein